MDYLIKCYLEQFKALPRSSLHDRRTRTAMVDYISTLIEGYSRGQNCDRQESVREAIIAIIRYHEANLSHNGSVCMMGKYHNILYVAVKLCFDWQLTDTATVILLLEQIYTCENTFERIFIGAIFGTKAPHFVAGWKSDFANQEENFRAVVYYIDHATNGNLELPYGPSLIRFIDLPIESCGKASALKICVQLGLPDKLHMLLRYGALVRDDVDKEDNLVEQLLRRLMEFRRVYPYNIVSCLQLILRITISVKVPREELIENYSELIEDALIPLDRCGIQVPHLKHLSRCSIRKTLWQNYQLPNGIATLSLPDSLKRYVDIMED